MTTIGFNPVGGRAQPKRIAASRPIKAEFIRLEGETAHLVWFLATRGDSESKSEYFTGGSGMNGQLLTGDGSPVDPLVGCKHEMARPFT